MLSWNNLPYSDHDWTATSRLLVSVSVSSPRTATGPAKCSARFAAPWTDLRLAGHFNKQRDRQRTYCTWISDLFGVAVENFSHTSCSNKPLHLPSHLRWTFTLLQCWRVLVRLDISPCLIRVLCPAELVAAQTLYVQSFKICNRFFWKWWQR